MSSRFDENTVSIAALQVDPAAKKSLPRLLGTGIRSLARTFPEATLRYTIATDSAFQISERLLQTYPLEATVMELKTACWNSIEG